MSNSGKCMMSVTMRTPADVRLLSVVTDALIDGGLVSKDIFNNKKKSTT